MMSNQSAQTFTDPAFQNKVPLFDGRVTSPGLPKPQNMSGFFSKQPVQYSGAYFAYDPRGQDTAAFSPPWSSSKSSLLDCRSPVSLSGLKGQNHIIYRQDDMLSSEKSHSPSVHHIPLKQGFTCYTKSPGISRPTSPTSVTVRKQKNGDGTSPPENSVYLAIPKPIYGQNPYCNELGCVIGQHYSVGHGSQRLPNPAYAREWVLTDSHYAERPSTERKAHDLLLQPRGLKVQPTAQPFKRETVETYSSLSPGRRTTLPAVMEQNYNSYPCTQARTLLGPLSEQSQHLQSSPRGYHSLYPSHPTYERMTSEVFQECSVSKYGQLTKHPMFYYPQTNVELENRRQTKDSDGKQRDDVPVILKRAVSSPRDHYVIPQSIRGEIPLPLPSTQSLPNHSFVQHFDYPCYAVPRVHLNGSPVGAPVTRQHAPPSGINISPTSQHMDHLLVSSANLHNDKPNTRLHTSPPFLHVDQPSSSRHIGQPEFSPVGIQIGKMLSPTTSMHIDRIHPSPVRLNMDRHLDYSPCNGQLSYLKPPRGFVISPGAQLPQSSNHNSAPDQTPLGNGSNLQKIFYSPTVAKRNEHNGSATVHPTGILRKHLLDSPPCSNIKEETKNLCQVGPIKKRPKMEKEENKNDSPPMPVIDVVFSLAPYKSYLQKARALSPAKDPRRTVHSPEVHEVETKSCIKEKSPDNEEQLPVVCAQSPSEKSDEDVLEPKRIKLEKGDPDGDMPVRKMNEEDYSETSVKMEKREDGSPKSVTLFVINKCKPEELERKPSRRVENNPSDNSAQRELAKDMETFSEGNTCTERTQVAVPNPKSVIPPEPSQNKINFKNIPLQCLKLSTYNIILPDTKHSNPVPVVEKYLGMPGSAITPHLEHQMPVRKHFFELHHSVCRLVSRSVSVSSKEDLRTWLSHLELVETPSHNVQKLSCLLGVKAREVWLNEEIKSALHEVLERLMEYISVDYCPFPHVIRAGAVFIPMLVLKELLFPSVQGNFIDKVLQEHKVVLRPTTLSEEKLLIQLHKRSCSSKLRRLMSLKYLPNVYTDVVNLYYHACVCRHLGIDLDESSNRDTDEGCEENKSCTSLVRPASPASESDSHVKAQHSKSQKPKSRITSSSRRLFLNDSMSEEEDAGNAHQSTGGTQDVAVQEASSISSTLSLQKPTSEDSWTCPLSADELSLSPGNTETDNVSAPCTLSQSSLSVTDKSQVPSKTCSGVILKLKRLCGGGVNRKTSYQAVSQLGINTDCPLSEREITGGDVSSGSERDFNRRGKVAHRRRRVGGFTRTLRPLSSSSNRKHRSFLKIKYCPYLSACHSSEHRRRWVLRSAVQKAQRAMRLSCPDLVGKRIRHLYEEDDKSEVWYRGEVLRIHEVHANPLKTVFEVRYDSEPEWKYYLELLMDYKKGWLKIEE